MLKKASLIFLHQSLVERLRDFGGTYLVKGWNINEDLLLSPILL